MGVNLTRADEEEEQSAATGRSGLVWDPEEGPVWRYIRGAEEQKLEDTWTQLLNEGVSGITSDSDGEDKNPLYIFVFVFHDLGHSHHSNSTVFSHRMQLFKEEKQVTHSTLPAQHQTADRHG